MKKFICLIFTIVLTSIFTLASCTLDNSISSSPASSLENSSTSSISSSLTNPENDTSTDSSLSQQQTFQATDADVDITSTVANDKLSVLIEVTPKYYIQNLKIYIKFFFSDNTADYHCKTFDEKLTPTRTLSFRIYLSEDLIAKGEKIGIYEYKVIGGTYEAETIEVTNSFKYIARKQTIEKYAEYCDVLVSVSTSKQSVTLNILPYSNLYDVTISVCLELKDSNKLIDVPLIKLEQLYELKIHTTLIYLPKTYIEQGITIDDLYITVNGTHRIYPEIEVAPPPNLGEGIHWSSFY